MGSEMCIRDRSIGTHLMCDGRAEGWTPESVEGSREVFTTLEDRKKQRSSGGHSA